MSSPTLTDKVSKMIRQDILYLRVSPVKKARCCWSKEIDTTLAHLRFRSPSTVILEQIRKPSCKKAAGYRQCQRKSWMIFYESLRVVSSVLLEKAISAGDETWELMYWLLHGNFREYSTYLKSLIVWMGRNVTNNSTLRYLKVRIQRTCLASLKIWSNQVNVTLPSDVGGKCIRWSVQYWWARNDHETRAVKNVEQGQSCLINTY